MTENVIVVQHCPPVAKGRITVKRMTLSIIIAKMR